MMKHFISKKTILFSFFIITFQAQCADLIIFSYNRPLQLEALLRSLDKHVTHLGQVSVLYRSSNKAFETAYQELQQACPSITFVRQGTHPKKDFKPLLLNIMQQLTSDYILFAVDDIIVTDKIDIRQCIQALEKTGAYGFYLRLGKNITFSYTQNIPLIVPHMTSIDNDIFSFSMQNNKSYWSYPNTVDMTLYRKNHIMPAFKKLQYCSPNTLEGNWHLIADLQQNGLCFGHSRIVNTPLNVVQDHWNSKHNNSYSVDELLEIWQAGLRLDIDDIYHIKNNAAHISYHPKFKP